ncbi:MAG: hypothetical protein AAGJ32_03815 [Pseudomonadota bacterium]
MTRKPFRTMITGSLALLLTAPAFAQDIVPAGDFRTCPGDQTRQGKAIVMDACGAIEPPMVPGPYGSLPDLLAAQAARDAFNSDVAEYGRCVTDFINLYRRPGADASSKAPDQAACAHAWAEQQATELVRDVGFACIDFSNRTMMDSALEPWSGDCFPTPETGQG